MLGDKTRQIYLGHLSRENNMKEIARESVENILYKKGTGVNDQFFLYDTDPDEATPFEKALSLIKRPPYQIGVEVFNLMSVFSFIK